MNLPRATLTICERNEMVTVLIRRSVNPDKELDFLEAFQSQRPAHEDFIEESLVRLNCSEDLPAPMRTLTIGEPGSITYLNIAKWKSATSFEEWFGPKTMHDPGIETADRLRAVLDVVSITRAAD